MHTFNHFIKRLHKTLQTNELVEIIVNVKDRRFNDMMHEMVIIPATVYEVDGILSALVK